MDSFDLQLVCKLSDRKFGDGVLLSKYPIRFNISFERDSSVRDSSVCVLDRAWCVRKTAV